eukprot:3406143-Alexandrium_andersonii.AAC.1
MWPPRTGRHIDEEALEARHEGIILSRAWPIRRAETAIRDADEFESAALPRRPEEREPHFIDAASE